MKRLVVIKFGGGVITNKQTPFSARPAVITTLAQSVAAAHAKHPQTRFLLGNGAGSFGHFSAHEYGLREGAKNKKQLYGMAFTHSGVQKLNTLVTDALLAAELPAFSLTPSSFLFCDDTTVQTNHAGPLLHLLRHQCIPVVFGDTICDTARGTTILSTEKVLQACLQAVRGQFEVITVVYILAANGVLDAAGHTIPVLTSGMPVVPYNSLDHDVTGGIHGKVAAARAAAAIADNVYLINDHPQSLMNIVGGMPAGTRVVSEGYK